MRLTKRADHNYIKGEIVSSPGYCSKLAVEIDIFSLRLSKEKAHNRGGMSQEVEKIVKVGNIVIKKMILQCLQYHLYRQKVVIDKIEIQKMIPIFLQILK